MAKPSSHLDHYMPATWRGVSSVRNGWICMSFDHENGVIRFRLRAANAQRFLLAANGYLEKCGCQSLSSSEIPSLLGSPKDGQVPTPVATSSAAVCGLSYLSSESLSKMTCQKPSRWSAMKKVPRRVLWLYAMGLIALSFCAGIVAGALFL